MRCRFCFWVQWQAFFTLISHFCIDLHLTSWPLASRRSRHDFGSYERCPIIIAWHLCEPHQSGSSMFGLLCQELSFFKELTGLAFWLNTNQIRSPCPSRSELHCKNEFWEAVTIKNFSICPVIYAHCLVSYGWNLYWYTTLLGIHIILGMP